MHKFLISLIVKTLLSDWAVFTAIINILKQILWLHGILIYNVWQSRNHTHALILEKGEGGSDNWNVIPFIVIPYLIALFEFSVVETVLLFTALCADALFCRTVHEAFFHLSDLLQCTSWQGSSTYFYNKPVWQSVLQAPPGYWKSFKFGHAHIHFLPSRGLGAYPVHGLSFSL